MKSLKIHLVRDSLFQVQTRTPTGTWRLNRKRVVRTGLWTNDKRLEGLKRDALEDKTAGMFKIVSLEVKTSDTLDCFCSIQFGIFVTTEL